MPIETINIQSSIVRRVNFTKYEASADGGGYGGAWFADGAETSVGTFIKLNDLGVGDINGLPVEYQNRTITAVNIKVESWDFVGSLSKTGQIVVLENLWKPYTKWEIDAGRIYPWWVDFEPWPGSELIFNSGFPIMSEQTQQLGPGDVQFFTLPSTTELVDLFNRWRTGSSDFRNGLFVAVKYGEGTFNEDYIKAGLTVELEYEEISVASAVTPSPAFFRWGFTPTWNGLKTGSYGWFTESSTESGLINTYTALLIEQWRKSEYMKKYIKAFLTPMKRIEKALDDLQKYRYILTASGTQLDIIGEIVGVSRGGLLDTEYRTAIIFKIYLNRSHGTPEILIAFVKNLTEASKVHYIEHHPATVEIIFTTNKPVPVNLKRIIEDVAPSGVEILLTLSGGGKDFGYDGEGIYPPDSDTLGFGETGIGFETEGGEYVESIQ